MRNEQVSVLASLQRVQHFLDEHGDVLAEVNASTRAQLDDVTTQLSDFSISQDAGIRAGKAQTAKMRALRTALRRHYMAPIADLAELNLRDVPKFAALMLPPWDAKLANEVTAAHAMADEATEHLDIFIRGGLPARIVDDLRSAAVAVSDSIVERDKQHARRSGATAGLAAETKRGLAILNVLDALVLARIGNNAKLIAEWNSARVVRRKSGPAGGGQESV